MAKISRVWGIDIGQCALKALHCTRQGTEEMVADAFDYVEYPKILSQPEADPEQLVREALEQFLSRNRITREDKVAISVPGQSGLAKFFKPPPVDVKKIPDIVRYEARQQIPFPLDEVIWDFQQMAGGQEVEGFAIDTEVGLFAMKREQVYRYLRPFEKAEIELDIVQLSPLCIYNFVAFDLLTDGPSPDEFDPDAPPESIVVLSIGTDATDLVITNGFRVWQRSIPLGGSHFTKQLTKELKLTFAKAEHLKRNARQAEDPKTVFQAMRPIFNDMVTEIQRSIGYFQGIDRKAKIRGVVLLGNAVKLPGLQQYVAKNLGYDVIDFQKFQRLSGSSVLSSPTFSENILTFPVSYGLCLQGLGLSRLSTNLLPREIRTQRIIRAKKPWAVATAAALMLACAFNFFFHYRVWSKAKDDVVVAGVDWKSAEQKADAASAQSSDFRKTHNDKNGTLTLLAKIGDEVVGAGDRRLLWLELLKALNSALPWTEGVTPGQYVEFTKLPFDKRKELYIQYVESEYFPDLAAWFTEPVKVRCFELQRHLYGGVKKSAPAESAGTPGAAAAGGEDLGIVGPSGPGWVVELAGYHYYNWDRDNSGATHVRNTLLKNLEEGWVDLPIDGDRVGRFTFKELGISHAILAADGGEPAPLRLRNPDFEGRPLTAPGMPWMYPGGFPQPGAAAMGGMPGMLAKPGTAKSEAEKGAAAKEKPVEKANEKANEKEGAKAGEEEKVPPNYYFDVKKYSFVVQFCWKPTPVSERLKARLEKLKQQQAEEQAEEQAAKETVEPAAEGVATPAPAEVAPEPAAPARPAAKTPDDAPAPSATPSAPIGAQ